MREMYREDLENAIKALIEGYVKISGFTENFQLEVGYADGSAYVEEY